MNVFIFFSSAYFETKLTTLVGDLNKVVRVEECSSFVLAKVIDFMYDIKLPAHLSYEDAIALLAMADLYMMEDLKDAAGSLIADRHLEAYQYSTNILEISKTAAKYTATKLQERCCKYVLKTIHYNSVHASLKELNKTLPNLGEMALYKLAER